MRSMSDGAGVSVRGVLVIRLSPRDVHVAVLTIDSMCWSRVHFLRFLHEKTWNLFLKNGSR